MKVASCLSRREYQGAAALGLCLLAACSAPPTSSECSAECAEGWTCSEGGCVLPVAIGEAGLAGLSTDGQFIYWSSLGTYDVLGNYRHDCGIFKAPIGGTEAVTLAGDVDHVLHVVVDD